MPIFWYVSRQAGSQAHDGSGETNAHAAPSQLDGANKAYIADFGCAKILHYTDHQSLQGTPGYTPPEVLADVKAWSAQGDIYSLAMVLFCLFVNPRLWDREGMLDHKVPCHRAATRAFASRYNLARSLTWALSM